VSQRKPRVVLFLKVSWTRSERVHRRPTGLLLLISETFWEEATHIWSPGDAMFCTGSATNETAKEACGRKIVDDHLCG